MAGEESKANGAMVGALPVKRTETRESQNEKASSPIDVTPEGMVREAREGHPVKA